MLNGPGCHSTIRDHGRGSCCGKPTREGADFLAFVKGRCRTVQRPRVHVVLGNLSTHKSGDVEAWLAQNPNVDFHFTSVGSSWLSQIENWFGIVVTRQSIRHGTFASVKARA